MKRMYSILIKKSQLYLSQKYVLLSKNNTAELKKLTFFFLTVFFRFT